MKSSVGFTISDFLEVPGLYEVRLHKLKPPEELGDERHHVLLEYTVQYDHSGGDSPHFSLLSSEYSSVIIGVYPSH